MSGYVLHPEGFSDIDELATYIGQDSTHAAHRVLDEIHRAIQSLVPMPHSPRAMAAILRGREERPQSR
jgi:plasmid stabilization system protein ParE